MGSMVFRDPQALIISSTLAALGTLQPRAFMSLNTIEPLVSLSTYYNYSVSDFGCSSGQSSSHDIVVLGTVIMCER